MTNFHFFRTRKADFVKRRLEDRKRFVKYLENDLDLVKQGAVYFLGLALCSSDIVPSTSFSISHMLLIFKSITAHTKNYPLIKEILYSTNQLVGCRQKDIAFEWDLILDIVEIMIKNHLEILLVRKKLLYIDSIFKYAQDQILLQKY